MKKLSLLLFLLFASLSIVVAQRTVTGVVKDQGGLALIGANVLVKGTTVGTITDIDGSFSLSVPDDATMLEVTYTGFTDMEIPLVADQSMYNIELSEGAVLNEVVVTALGIEKEARTLGYGVDKLDAEELTRARSTNVVNSLQGKVTGTNIVTTDGNLGGSTKILIRGATSLSGNNNPLWVIDGVPINNNQFVSNGTRISGNRDFGNGASMINPDDIESMNILKGAAATALYGSRAAAGAVIIQTKRGSSSGSSSPNVEYSVSYRADDLFVTPQFQNQYGMGDFAKYDSSSIGFDWGPEIRGQEVNSLPITGETGPLTAVDNNGINDFFRTGTTVMNNLAISQGDEKYNYRLGLGALNQTGILPGAALDRYNASLNIGVNHSEKFNTSFGVMFAKQQSVGTGATGANDPNVLGLSSFSSTLNPALFDPWIDEAGNQVNQAGPISNNYLWIRNENRNDRDDTRIIGNVSTTYKVTDDFTLKAIYGYDFDQDNRFITNRKGTIQQLGGDFRVNNINNVQQNIDVTANYAKPLSDKLTFNALAGYNFNNRKIEVEGVYAENLSVAELFDPGNAEVNTPIRNFSERNLFGLYGSLDFTYDNWATLTFTGRNDWSSTLPAENRSYFYPSVSTALVLSDALDIENDFLSYLKVRGSWAQVGNDTDPYQLNFVFNPISLATGQYGLDLTFPFDGSLAFSKVNTIPPTNLLPERQTSFEVGAEVSLLDYRVNLDVTYFHTRNDDQILAVPIPESTGFGFLRQNVGQVNTSGIEISLDATPVSTKNFTWKTSVNFSTANVEVVELAGGVDRVQLASAFNSVQVVAEVGKGFELFAIPFLRDSATNRPLINPNTGTRLAGEAQTMGSVLPDFNMGFVNNLQFGPVGVSFTVDWRSGGVMKSSTVEDLQVGGLVEETLLNREGTFIDSEGVIDNGDGTVRDNDVPLASAADFWQALDDNSVAEAFIYDASFVKLRELAITYDLPTRLFKGSFIRGISVGVEGRNLALLYSAIPHIDPENSLFGAGSDGFGVERASVPTTRSVGVNLKARF